MKQFKSVAIIGSNGMVGSDLILELEPYFQTITGINRENYSKYIGQQFDIIINANGNSSKIWAKKNILGDFEASTVSVYKSLFDFSSEIYIFLSSADVYEDHTSKKNTKESQIINPEKLIPYGFHKYLSENIVKNAAKKYLILRCPMMLGTNLKKGPIYDIMRSSPLFIDAESAFQMITTQELARIILFFVDNKIVNETFNVGGTNSISFKNIHKFFNMAINFPQNGPIHTYEMDVTKLHKIYPLKSSNEYLQDLLMQIK